MSTVAQPAARIGRPWLTLAMDVDSRMVAAGISARAARVALDGERVAAVAAELGTTRSAAGMLLAAQSAGSTAVYVVGNAPTALFALLEAGVEPPLVIGLPVGFVDAVELLLRRQPVTPALNDLA